MHHGGRGDECLRSGIHGGADGQGFDALLIKLIRPKPAENA
jgi:hypothetical protein